MQNFFSRLAFVPRFLLLSSISVVLTSIACREATTPPVPAGLTFTVQPPASVIAGTQMLPAVSVAVQDAAGNTVTTAANIITVTLGTNPSGGTLSGNLAVAAVNGVAVFSGLSINRAGAGYTLSASTADLTGAVSSSVEVKPGPASRLVFTVQPVSATAGTPIPAVLVTVQDALGNAIPNANNIIFMGIGANPTNAALVGTTSVAPVNGVAAFSSLRIDKAGVGYTLSASGSGFASVASNAFTVAHGAATKLVFTSQPASTTLGSTLAPAVAVAVQDIGDNIVLTASHNITISMGANPSNAMLSGTTTVSTSNGIATFSGLSVDKVGTDYTLTATAPDLAGRTSAPFTVRNLLNFTLASAGYFHSCGIIATGSAYCWGSNESGQLGGPALSQTSVPTAVVGGLTFATISTGRDHTCGVTPAGAAHCWGSNGAGELGNGGAPGGGPVAVSGGLTFAEVNAAYSHTCGVTTSGTGFCWGSGNSGQLGNGTTQTKLVPTAVAGDLKFASIRPGRQFTCGVTTTGVAYCWGSNGGWLGDGTNSSRETPVQVLGQLAFATVMAGGFHSCGLTTAGAAYCWGLGAPGVLGNGTQADSFIPVAVSGGLTFRVLSVGNRHNCAVTTAGVAYCWGDNSNGNLGDGTMISQSVPVKVAGGLSFASISAGRFHTCGVTTSDEAYCWGSNFRGELGDGTTKSSPVPTRVR